MQFLGNRRLLVFLLLIVTCFIIANGKRGGGSRGGGSRGSSTRYRQSNRYRVTSRPATYRPATFKPGTPRSFPAPTPKPARKQRPENPSPKPQVPTSKPSNLDEPVVVKQPASNPNFKETNPHQTSPDKQPAYNPNYKEGNAPGGPPPPYSPAGQPAPSAPQGPPPAYGSPGGHYAQPGAAPYPGQPGVQPPPYSGPLGRPPAYPGLPTHPGSAPYPVQPGGYPQQPGGNRPYPVQQGAYPGGYPQQPGGYPGGYPQQPGGYPGGYPQQPGGNRPYPVQPGSYNLQPGMNRPYPQQPGFHQPYPQQTLGSNVWHAQSGMPAPAYMNYGGLPTGTNMYTKPHKKKGFLGSLMSVGGGKHDKLKKQKYYGSYPSPYSTGHMGKHGFMGKHGSSAAMYAILPYMAMKAAPKFRPRMPFFLPIFLPMPHFHYGYYGHGMYPQHVHYYDIYNEDYVGKCQRPLRKKHYAEMRCKSSYKEIECGAKCEEGYTFPDNTTIQYNKCWHVSGVWRPIKNYPECKPVCEDGCQNGGECLRPGFCECPAEFRGDRCQVRKSNFLDCDFRNVTKQEKVGWVCNHTKNETVCKIRCKEPGKFETPPADEYKCTPGGKWTPNSIPHCVVKGGENVVSNRKK